MTHAFGGGGDLTLATLYVPVRPAVTGLHEEMVRVGEQASRSLVQGLDSSVVTNLGSAMALGLQRSMPAGLSHAFGELNTQLNHLGQGTLAAQTAFDRYTNSMRLSQEAANGVHSAETKVANNRNQMTNVAAQIAASEALISEHYLRGSESSKTCQKEVQNLQNLRTKGNNLATQSVMLEGQASNAQMLHTQRVQESTTAHERYNEALQQTHSHLNLGAIGTAALTGAVTGLTMAAVNLASEGLSAVVRGFEDVAKGGMKAVEGVINVGQHFQDLNRQVQLFTTESGPALQSLQEGMRNVFANLDVPADRLGETFGVLHQQFGFTGEGLEKVSRHLTELGARFGGIDVREFSATMHQFGVEGVEPVDKALGQLIFDSQKYGVTVQSLQNSMVQMGPIWDALGVNYNSAAMAVARIEQLGDPARRVMLGLSATAKEMAKGPDPQGSFKQYMKDVLQTGENLQKSGGDQLADAFAQSEFSVRNWAILKQTYGIMSDAMNDVGAEGDNIDLENLIISTRTLHEKFRLFFNDVEARLAPLGLNIVNHIGGGLDIVKNWFDTHQTEIIAKIKEWGDKFIDNIPAIQHFIGEAVKFIGDFVTFSVKSFGFVGEALGMLFGNKDMEDLGRKITNFDMRPLTDKISNEIEYGLHIDVGALRTWWDNEAIPGLVKNQPKIDIKTDLTAPDGTSLLDDNKIKGFVKDKGEKIGGALVDGLADGANKAWEKAKENMPAAVRWALEFPNKSYNWLEKFNPLPGLGEQSQQGTNNTAPPEGGWTTPGGETEPQLSGEPHQANTSGFTVPMVNAPTGVMLVGAYDIDPHAHDTASAPPGIGIPSWSGMPKSSKSSGKDPRLQAQERQDRIDNAKDSLDNANDAYDDAVSAAKIAEEKDKPLIDKFRNWAAAAPPGSKLREGYEEQLDAATRDLTRARQAVTHALHAKGHAERGLTEAEMKAEEPEKSSGDDANMQKLGQSLIPGLMQEMGFGDVFGKAPNEWGVFKILGGALQWALKSANAFGNAGIKLGPHGLTMPSSPGGPGDSAPVIVGPQEVSPFGPDRGSLPGPGQNASQTWWGEEVKPQLGLTKPQTMWGYPVPPKIPRGTALASATFPSASSSYQLSSYQSSQPVGAVPAGGYAVNPATAAGALRLGGTTTDAFYDAQRRGVETNAPLYAKGLNTQGYGNSKGLPQWAIDIGAKFGLAPSTYPEGGTLHQAGYAMDFAPTPGNSDPVGSMDRFSTYVKQNLGPQTLELIHDDPKTGQKWGMAGARPVGPGTDMPGYFSNDWGGHQDHVHWATDVPPVQGYQTGGLVGFDKGGLVSTEGGLVGTAGVYNPPLPYQGPKGYGHQARAGEADVEAQRQTRTGMFDPRYYGKYLPPGNFNSDVQLDPSYAQMGDSGWPFQWPRTFKGGHGLYPRGSGWDTKRASSIAPWDTPDGHADGGVIGFQHGGFVGFDGGGHVPPDPSDPGGLAPWDLGVSHGPVVRYPEGGTKSWDNSHSPFQSPPSGGSWRPPTVKPWWTPQNLTSGTQSPGGTIGKGSGYYGAGMQPGGDWVKSTETTAIGSHYKIKSGDTLSDIAQRSGVSISDIQKANNITNPDMINADAIIKLPGGRGWFGTPSSGVGTPSSGFSTQSPIKLSPRTSTAAVIPMSSQDAVPHIFNNPNTPNPEPRGDNGSILGRILAPLKRAWLGFAHGGVAAADPWVSPGAPYPDTGGAGHYGHYPRHTPWWKEDDPGFNIPARPPGPWGTALPPVGGTVPPGTLPRHHPKADPRRPQDWHPSHMFQHGGVVGFAEGGDAGGVGPHIEFGKDPSDKVWWPDNQPNDHWPFHEPYPRGWDSRPDWWKKILDDAGKKKIAKKTGHAKGGVVQGFAQGGVVGFDQGGQAGGTDNFYKHWYPRSNTPTPTASTPMLRPNSLGELLGSTDTQPSAPAATPPSAVKPWGVMTKPAPDAAHPLQGFRSLEDEHRATGFGRLSRAVSSFTGVLPDVALDYNTLTHWGQHTGMEQTGAIIDTASMIPGLGAVLGEGAGAVGRGAAHGIKALQAARFSRGLPDEFRIASGRLGGAGAAAQQHPRWPQYQKYVNHNEVIGPRLGYLPQKSLSFEEWIRLQDQAELGDDAVEAATRRAAEVKPPAVSTATDLTALQDIVHKPTANNMEMREFVQPWGNANAWRTMQPGVMKGIYDALKGQPGGITPEAVHAIAQWQNNAWRWTPEQYAANTPPEMEEVFRLFGSEVAANMVHSDPTDRSIFRGVAWPHERAEALKKGQILSMNRPASFAREEEAAAEAALFRQEWQHNYKELMTLPERLLDVKEPERSILKEKIAKLSGGRRPGNTGAYIDTIGQSGVYAPGWDPILWELDQGAQVADLSNAVTGWDELLGMGRFKISDLQRQEPWGLIRGKLQQTAINPDTGGFAYGGLASTDTIPAMLTPGEVVLSKNAVDAIGLDTALGINALGLADGGQVPATPTQAPNIQLNPDLKEWAKQQSIDGAMSGISSIISGLGADFNPKQWQGILQQPEARPSAVHYNNSIHISGNTIADPTKQQQAQQEKWNSRFETTTGGLPMPSVGAP